MKHEMTKTAIAGLLSASALFLIFIAETSQAQTSASSGSASQSQAGAAAGASINIGGGGTSGGGIGSTGGAGLTGGGASTSYGSAQGQSITYSPQSNSYVKGSDYGDVVPNMIAPGLGGGGSNPCVVSISGAGVGSGFGLAFGRSWNDEECTVRESLRVMGGQLNSESRYAQTMQKNIACQSEVMRKALNQTARETGQPGLKCASTFGEDTTAPKAQQVAYRSTNGASAAPRSSGGSYADAVQKCRSVPDRSYGACMKKARSLR